MSRGDLMPKKKNEVRIIPLGGIGEVGKNMLVLEYGDELIVIDAGLMFPEEEMLGIDLVLPNFNYLKRNKDKIKAIILTHGHEDHTGSLPYVIREIGKVPIIGTKLTLGIVKAKLIEFGLEEVKLKEVEPPCSLKIGSFEFDFIRVAHSIPDGVGLAIQTPVGLIVHTGDFKLDRTPIDNMVTDLARFATLKQKDVLALLSDSTNSEFPGYTLSERVVGITLGEICKSAKRTVVVAAFASHIHRIQQVADVAATCGRKLAIAGRSMQENVEIATNLGYLKISSDNLIDILKIGEYPPSQVVVLCTGSQGEPLSALSRVASGEHAQISISPGDTVIISARAVPGNERSVHKVINQLYRRGADVYYKAIRNVHASGHATQEELKLMLNLVEPKYLIPVHGEYRQLKQHARLAEESGIPKNNILIVRNGDIIKLTKRGAKVNGKVESGIVLVDGLSLGGMKDAVLRDRKRLSKDGIFIVVVTINIQSGDVLGEIEVTSRGFTFEEETEQILEEARANVKETLTKTAAKGITDASVIQSDIRSSLNRFIYERIKRRPMIIPIVVET